MEWNTVKLYMYDRANAKEKWIKEALEYYGTHGMISA